jgi:uncharacterized membrane protein (DUF2068 family)
MRRKGDGLLRLIAVYKLLEVILCVVGGFAALHLGHDGHAVEQLGHLAGRLGVGSGSRLLSRVLARVANLPPKTFLELGIGSFVYAALFAIEGVGLWLRKRWAEWFTAILTASLVPVEVYEVCRHATAGKVVVMLLNVATVVYLVVRIRRDERA